MKYLCPWLWSLLALIPVPCTAGDAQIPSRISAPSGGDNSPIWVSADEATSSDGRFRSELFNRMDQLSVGQLVEAERKAREASGLAKKTSRGGCHSWLTFPGSPDVDPLTLSGLLDYSQLAFIGTVEDQQQGFYHGHPNSLMQIKVERVLKAPPGYEGIPSVLATYPQVEMKVGHELICMRADRYPARPITGKGIMIFARNIPDWDPLIIAANTDGILFEDAAGMVVLPSRFGNVIDPPTWDSVVEQALGLVESPGGGGGPGR